MIVSVSLAKGAIAMSRKKVIVKRLSAIQNLGAMDVLCTDKTGTLTMGVVKLDAANGVDGKPSKDVLRYAYLNARFQTGMANPMEPFRAAMLLTPTTSPAMLTSGPPELPGLTAASV